MSKLALNAVTVSLAEEFGSTSLQSDTASLAGRTYELSEFLVDVLGATDVGAYFPHAVTYHPTCHSLRVVRVGVGQSMN